MTRRATYSQSIIWRFSLVFFLLFCGAVFHNARIQTVPDFRYHVLPSGEWVINKSQDNRIKKGTVITALRIDSKTYALDKQWLFSTLFSVRTYAELHSGFVKERLLYDASQMAFSKAVKKAENAFVTLPNVQLIDRAGHHYPVSIRDYRIGDTAFFSVLLYVLGWLKFICSVVVARIGVMTPQKIAFLVSAVIFGVMCFMSNTAMSRTWAVEPSILQTRFSLLFLVYSLYWCSFALILLHAPMNLFKRLAAARALFFMILAYALTSWGLYALVSPEAFYRPLILAFFILPVTSYVILYWQWRYVHQHNEGRLSMIIALKGMWLFIITSSLVSLVSNMGTQLGWIESTYANIIVSANNSIILSIGIAGLILYEQLYKIENAWWQAWGALLALALAFSSMGILVETALGFSYTTFAFCGLLGLMGYFMLVNYFRMNYAKAESQLLELTIPNLLEIKNKNNTTDSINAIWQDILQQAFLPKTLTSTTVAELTEHRLVPHNAPHPLRQDGTIAVICDAGEMLIVQGADDCVFLLARPSHGLKLFSQDNVEKVTMLWKMVWQTYQASLAYQAGEVAERKRIAYDLHDDLGGKLLHLSSQSGAYGEYASQTLQDLRTLTHALSHDARSLSSIIADMRYQIRHYCDNKEIELFFDNQLSGRFAEQPISAQAAINVTCILNELTRNAVQNASTTTLWITLAAAGEHCTLYIENDGLATDPTQWIQGLGTVSSERRANQLRGHIDWQARAGGGVICCVTWHIDSMF